MQAKYALLWYNCVLSVVVDTTSTAAKRLFVKITFGNIPAWFVILCTRYYPPGVLRKQEEF